MTFSVDGTALKCTSETVKKSLDPVWKQVMTLELPKGPAEGLKLQGKCEDVDEVSGADFMGTASARLRVGPSTCACSIYRASATPGCRTSPRRRCDGCLTLSHAGQFEVDLNDCLDGTVKRIWRSLEPRTEKDEVSGDVELVLQWRYNARLDFCPFDGFVDEHEGKPLCGNQPVS